MAGQIGLDIGTMAVRAAEVTLRDQVPSLEHFGQVALPYGAVRNGEIADVGAVGEAIQRLWVQTGFRSKKVVIGLANQRVFVRQAELPAMAEQEIRDALQFEAQEFIPIPIEDVEIDFRVIESVISPEGEAKVRILLAAAQKEMVHNAISAAELAGLRVMKVDLIPFALVRALSPLSYASMGESSAEAIVSVGAGITNVVVHEQGVPRFVRILSMGGSSVTEAIAEGLDVDLDTAEELKRYSYMRPSDPRSAHVAEIVATQVRPLLQEIQGSLQFYGSQADAAPLARVLVAGGGSLTPGLFDQLTAQNDLPVQPALILGSLHLGRTGLSEQDLTRSEPVMAAPLGLALAPYDPRSISLLPTHLAHRANLPAQIAIAATLCAVILGGLVYLWYGKGSTLSSLKSQVQTTRQQDQVEKAKIPSQETLKAIQSQNEQNIATVKGALTGDVDWVLLLNDIAQKMPEDTWVSAITLSANASQTTSSTAPSSSGTSALGKATFSVVGTDILSASQWMEDFSSVPSIADTWLGAITQQPTDAQWQGTSGGGSSGSGGLSGTGGTGGGTSSVQSTSSGGFGAPGPNPSPSAALCIIPGHCTVSFTASATITSQAASGRVDCYVSGFTSSTCPYRDVTGAGS